MRKLVLPVGGGDCCCKRENQQHYEMRRLVPTVREVSDIGVKMSWNYGTRRLAVYEQRSHEFSCA